LLYNSSFFLHLLGKRICDFKYGTQFLRESFQTVAKKQQKSMR